MLSPAKISVRNDRKGEYYLQLSHEDYYVTPGEPLGVWCGRGAAKLGLRGTVDQFAFVNLLDGVAPDGETPLLKMRPGAKHAPGWDLTFSAPKGVSVLWANSDAATQQAIQRMFAESVQAALDYVESEYKLARRGAQGRTQERADLVAAMFEHGTSRELEPNLHIHLLLLNTCVRDDGTTGAIRSQPVFEDKKLIGFVQRRDFAARLQQGLGLTMVWQGDLFDIEVPRDVTWEFSTRRQQILAKLDKLGLEGGAAAAIAAVATRRPKQVLARGVLFEGWQERSSELGFGPEQAQALLAQGRERLALAAEQGVRFAEQREGVVVGDPRLDPQREAEPVRGAAELPRAEELDQSHGAGAQAAQHEQAEDRRDPADRAPVSGARDVRDDWRRAWALDEEPTPEREARDQAPELADGPEPAAEASTRSRAARRGDQTQEAPVRSEVPGRDFDEAQEARDTAQQTVDRLLDERGAFTWRQAAEATLRASRDRPLGVYALFEALRERLREFDLLRDEVRRDALYVRAAEYERIKATMLEQASVLAESRGGALTAAARSAGLWHQTLNEDQMSAYELLTGPGRLKVVEHLEGAQPQAALKTAQQAWRMGGYRVVGVARSAHAAQEFEEQTGIKTYTMAEWRDSLTWGLGDRVWHHLYNIGATAVGAPLDWSLQDRLKLDRNTILVAVDAGAFHVEEMALCIEATGRSGAQFVPVGDTHRRPPRHQLDPRLDPEVKVTNPFRDLVERINNVWEMGEVTRPKEAWHRDAVWDLAYERMVPALEASRANGRLTLTADDWQARHKLIDAWRVKGVRNPREHLILAPYVSAARNLNHLAQNRRKALGRLGDEAIKVGRESFHRRDRVVFESSSPSLSINAGDMGSVVTVERMTRTVVVRLDNDKLVAVPLRVYRDMHLGYAVVGRRDVQRTAEHIYALLGPASMQNYVEVASGVRSAQLYLSAENSRGEVRSFVEREVRSEAAARVREAASEQQQEQAEQERRQTVERLEEQRRQEQARRLQEEARRQQEQARRQQRAAHEHDRER